jgi:hypothetical protein
MGATCFPYVLHAFFIYCGSTENDPRGRVTPIPILRSLVLTTFYASVEIERNVGGEAEIL